jgi:hypothetical protein
MNPFKTKNMKIKSSLMMTFALIVVANLHLSAQTYVGLKLGGNFANTRTTGLTSALTPDMGIYNGWIVGATGEIPLSPDVAFRPEINFTQKGFITPISTDIKVFNLDVPIGIKTKTRFNYVETPLLFQYSPKGGDNGWYIFAGPSVGYLAQGEIRPVASILVDINLPIIPLPLNSVADRWEISGIAGIGITVPAGHGKIFVDARYQYGFTNVLRNPIIDVKVLNTGISAAAGYAYAF